MRLVQYLTEENIDEYIPILKRDCKPIIKIYKKTKNPLYRGIYGFTEKDILKKKVRTKRKPRVISLYLHKLLDNLFYKIHGWRARSQGLFCGNYGMTAGWGTVYIIFPIGKFKYLWVKDPSTSFWPWLSRYVNYKPIEGSHSDIDIEGIENDIKEMYKNKGIEQPLNGVYEYEAILQCKEYYAIKDLQRKKFDEIQRQL